MTFAIVAGILCHLQGGKTKIKESLGISNRMPVQTLEKVNHLLGGSVINRRYSSISRSSKKLFKNDSSAYPARPRLERLSSVVFDKHLEKQQHHLRTTSNNPDLYHFPSEAYPEYQRIPALLTFICFTLSIYVSYLTTLTSMMTHKQDIDIGNHQSKTLGWCIIHALGIFTLFVVIIQDFLYSPSRLPTKTLVERNWFPSPLSRFSNVHAVIPTELNHDENTILDADENPSANIRTTNIKVAAGVHFLEYKNAGTIQGTGIGSDKVKQLNIDVVHFMHGFGANCLSWIAIIRPLVERLGAKVGIAHDAVGFGFTDRPSTRLGTRHDLAPYSSAGWAAFGNALLLDRIIKDDDGQSVHEDAPELNGLLEHVATSNNSSPYIKKRVVLIGHSMGSAATLKMALVLPKEYEKVVILIAPALVGLSSNTGKSYATTSGSEHGNIRVPLTDPGSNLKDALAACIRNLLSRNRAGMGVVFAYLRHFIMDSIIAYLLRRSVATAGFWTTMLNQIGGFVTNDDALNYQWPAIGYGWERGLLAFSRSRVVSSCPYAGGEHELLDEVLMLPEVSLFIVHGTNDVLVPISLSRKLVKEAFTGITLLEMEGFGHIPHEENPKEFMDLIESIIDMQ